MRRHFVRWFGIAGTLLLSGVGFATVGAGRAGAVALTLPPLTLPPLTVPPLTVPGVLPGLPPDPGGIPTAGPVASTPPAVAGAASTDVTAGDATTTTVGADATTTTTTGDATTSTTAAADTTTTTAGGGPTTTVAGSSSTSTSVAAATTVHGSSTATNNCPVTVNPPLITVPPATVTATIASDAFPQPHHGQPITLSNGTLTVTVPGSVLQTGVDAGVLHDGDHVPTTVTLVVSGSSTVEGTHTYHVSGDATVHVVNGKAQPIASTVALPNTTWTPVNATSNVFFAEKSMTIVSTLQVPGLGTVTATLNCTPTSAPPFLAVAAQGTAVPVGAATTPPAPPAAASAAPAAPAASTGLPFTGGNAGVLLALAAACIALGLAVKRGTGWRSIRS